MNRYIRRILAFIIAAMILSSACSAIADAVEMDPEARSAFVECLFSAAAGTTYEDEKKFRASMDAQTQTERDLELESYRNAVLDWLLAAFGTDYETGTEGSWTPDESYVRMSETETGRAYIAKMEEMGCTNAADALEVTRRIVSDWLDGIDHEALNSINEDYVFWLYSPDSPIDYPVVQGGDNEYYLKRLLNGERNACGTLFVDCRNLPDFADPNTLIYGHHMRNGSMFKSISDYDKPGYFAAHPYFLIVTPQTIWLAKVIAGYTTGANDHCYDIAISDRDDLSCFIDEAVQKSDFRIQVEPTMIDRLITLSTCAYAFEDARYVVIGQLSMLVGPDECTDRCNAGNP